ncbi:MerR family transcriptional regulator [Actinorugispora endophytica]|uniref:DNA-binding transcriptional MerR regulator n=1 Tax=Actinorugispora endophytica TaxID=1605990 RepID=A0A4R6V4N5_9ACTN|nr:MerR family transcriptional regulator [Actinorugispora endophytica]TDQ53779.1 DNA-binding transcriptional MerR regulator [Actinorugispora endophytica]
MKSSAAEMSIGELAERFGLAAHVLRHWESVGVLRPDRRVNGRRRYTADHLTRVALILRGKDAGLTLEQMRDVLDAPGGPDRRELLTVHLGELDARIARLQLARRIVEHAASCSSDDFLTCPRVRGLLECSATAAPGRDLPRHTARVPSPSAGTGR